MSISTYTSERSRKQSPRTRLLLLVDPHPLTRGPASEFLRSAGASFDVIAVAHATAIDASIAVKLVGLSVLNIGAASVYDIEIGQEIRELGERLSGIPLVLLANSVRMDEVQRALRLGIRGYIPIYLGASDVLAGLRVVLAGGIFVPIGPSDTKAMATELGQDHQEPATREGVPVDEPCPFPPCQLTFREDEVLRFLREGRTNREIARELNMAGSTVKVHVRNIMRKLNATSRIQAVEIADRELMRSVSLSDEAVSLAHEHVSWRQPHGSAANRIPPR